MIQMGTKLAIADNSGAKIGMCIKPIKASSVYHAGIGDVFVMSVVKALPEGKVKKGDVRKAVVIRVKRRIKRSDGSTVMFDENAAVIIGENGDPIGTRVSGAVPGEELSSSGFKKITTIAKEII